ncbi:hypothetical protein THRCLA_09093 [Thraustotheca clavata]|uniref:Transmembrane protein n=1 Tax=Thraustotheca clavata TaxID=74557 RepID=A0A1V9YZD0_9STRA|nr:hypothetical protein THRCLA_09093 [Thraustotheca clavata]
MPQNAMTNCLTCKTAYVLKELGVEEDYKNQIRKEQLQRLLLVLLVVFIGSGVIWLIDRGTPKLFQWHWNGTDGKLYDWVGLDSCPQFLVYFIMTTPVVFILFIVLFIFIGLYMLFFAIVGAVGSAADRIGERRVRTVQTSFQQVKNLQPLAQKMMYFIFMTICRFQ